MPTAFVTGTTGQDGSFLAERLLGEGYEVHGLRFGAPDGPPPAWTEQVVWHDGDLADLPAMAELVARIAPQEIYNLAGITSVAQSWALPVLTAQVTGVAAVNLMQAAWELQESGHGLVKVLQPSSAEIFGSPATSPQDEHTPIAPESPYGAAKAFAHSMAGVYRTRGLAVSTVVLFNHESDRRPTTFVTRKITRTVAQISLGQADELALGNTDARRDWGWAPDYVDAMVRAVRHEQADDYVVATGVAHSVRDFVEAAFAAVGIDDVDRYVRIDPAFVRPVDATELRGDSGKARRVLGWQPSVAFDELVARMVRADVAELSGPVRP